MTTPETAAAIPTLAFGTAIGAAFDSVFGRFRRFAKLAAIPFALMLFLAVVWLLFMLDRSLASEAGFDAMRRYAGLPLVKLSLLVLAWAYCHHFCAGIRFLFLDLDKGVDKATARLTSVAVLVVSLALTAWLGWRLW